MKDTGPQSLRFAMVTTFYPPYNFGGDGIYVQRLARSLVRRGHRVEVIHDTDAFLTMGGTVPPDADAAEDDGVIVHRLSSRFPRLASLGVHQTGRPVSHRRQLDGLLGDRFDVIHFHNTSLIGGPGIWPAGRGLKLHTAHEHWLVCQNHILWRDARELCDARRCLTCSLRHKRPPQLWRQTGLLDRMARHVDGFIMLSRSCQETHRAFGFRHETRLVPSFLPDEPPMPKPREETPYFLCVGRLEQIKGFQEAVAHFRGPGEGELWIAGSGEYEAELRRAAGDCPRVRFLGRRSMSELKRLYAGARAVITPSLCYEVFPMVVLEAFREATPIIARARGPYVEIVEQSAAGLLFHTESDLGERIADLTRDPAEALRLGRNGRDAFERLWSEEPAMQAYFDLIARLGRRREAPAPVAARAQDKIIDTPAFEKSIKE